MVFEVCVSNLQSALAAQNAGADRIELCAALDVGGLTPSPAAIQTATRALNIPVHVLIRPREGNFLYEDPEIDLMVADIRFCREHGAAGVVFGALDESGMPAPAGLERLLEAAAGLDVTFHRAIDLCPDPLSALDRIQSLGIRRILSSGGRTSAWKGRKTLKNMVQKAGNAMRIMPGAGINAQNIRELAVFTGAREFHFTAKQKRDQPLIGNKLADLPGGYWESTEEAIRTTIRHGHGLV